MIGANPEQCREFIKLGAFIEHELHMYDPEGTMKWDPNQLYAWISALGPEHTVLSSDFGQRGLSRPVDAYLRIGEILLDLGLSEREAPHDHPAQRRLPAQPRLLRGPTMYGNDDPRAALATAIRPSAPTDATAPIRAPQYVEFDDATPAELSPAGSPTWYVRGQNFVLAYRRWDWRSSRDQSTRRVRGLRPRSRGSITRNHRWR